MASWVRRLVVSILLAVSGLLLGACGHGATPQPNVAIVLGTTDNAFSLSSKDAYLTQLALSLATENAQVTVIVADGVPSVVAHLDLNSQGPNSLFSGVYAKSNAKKLLRVLSHVTPTTPQANPLGAYNLAVQQISGLSGTKQVYLIDAGLQTTAPLPMQDGGIIGQPSQQVVRFITAEKDLANAHGITVTWLNFGAVSGTQSPLSQTQYQSLQQLWKTLLETSGASSVSISGARLLSDQPLMSWPPVSVVALTAPTSFDGPHYSSQGILFNLHDTIFGSGSATLTAASYATLAQDLTFIAKYPGAQLEISGYTDDLPDNRESNLTLSVARAQAVASWLEANGIPSTRIRVRGFGPLDPIASNATPQGRALNRRVSILIEK